jgi:hypothetical protein
MKTITPIKIAILIEDGKITSIKADGPVTAEVFDVTANPEDEEAWDDVTMTLTEKVL